MQISNKGIEILSHFKEDMGMAIGFEKNGYLFNYYDAEWQQMPKVAAILEANHVNFQLLGPDQVEARIPGLRCGVDHIDPEVRELLGLEPIAGGLFGADCGSFDPSQATVGYFERAATDFAARPVVQLNTEAVALTFDPAGRADGVKLRCGGTEETVAAGIVALCTGPWTNKLLERSGLPEQDRMPIISQKRMLFITDFPDQDPRWQTIPLTSIDQGIFFKFESGSLMVGKARIDAPDSLDTTFEPDYYVEEINLVMQERMPITARCKLKRGWARRWAPAWPSWSSPASTRASTAPRSAGAASRSTTWCRKPTSCREASPPGRGSGPRSRRGPPRSNPAPGRSSGGPASRVRRSPG